ncbi:MAG: polysaccharide deacetylase family protein [Bacteroidota bacterium]
MAIVQRVKSKLRRESIHLYRDIRHSIGMDNGFYRQAKGSRILIYHGICQSNHTKFNPIFLTAKTFEQHLQYYKRYFNVVTLDDYYNQKFSPDKFNICITFDDGFANNYKYVLPLLEKYQLPATFFITAIRHAGYDILWNDFLSIVSKYGPTRISYKNEDFAKDKLGRYYSLNSGIKLADMLKKTGFNAKIEMMETLYPLVPFKNNTKDKDYWLQMTAEQIKSLSTSPYATIGAHGYYHNDMAHINLTDSITEIILCKTYLENITQKTIRSFAFPYGSYTPQLVDAAKSAGYNQLLAMDFLFEQDANDAVMRERFTVNPFLSANNQMYATINRRYEQ